MVTSDMPQWRIPRDIAALVAADDDLTWTTDDWAPLEVSVIGGTSYNGREIPLAWQVELSPTDAETDGYAWAERVAEAMSESHPDLADQLHFEDTEMSACVVWVESEATCQRLVEVVWRLLQPSP